MSWLEKNPIGVVLASACGVLLLISAVLVFLWSRPVPSGPGEVDAPVPGMGPATDIAAELGPISEYRIVIDRPVFEDSRRPSVVDPDSLDPDGLETTVAGAPEVMLTGVVITMNDRLATLKSLNQGKSVIAREGVPLEGEYVGWTVTDIEPRRIVLSSQDGESLELDLQVNTRRIAEPPEPEPAEVALEDKADKAPAGEGEPPLSRAEEIRQRIAERRAELRREQEMKEQAGTADRQSQYQSAIREMINDRSRSSSGSQPNEKKDDNDG